MAFSRKDLVKISDYIWEVPKSFREDMRVPARIFASEKLLDEILSDNSINQLVNLTTLPGIQKYSLAMPDIHEGYGAPIGGVAGIDINEGGVISPGMCVVGSTKILHSFGYYLPIFKFKNKIKEKIKCISFNKKEIEDTEIIKFFKIKTKPYIYQITTLTGQKIKATPDHPFYTPKGMIELNKLKIGDRIALYPFEGVKYEKPSKTILVDEDDIKKHFKILQQDAKGHGLSQIINQLKKRNLLPLSASSFKFAILLKIMGYILGDGYMGIVNNKNKKTVVICFYGNRNDLLDIKKDLKLIGFKSTLFERNRTHQIKTIYKTYSFTRKQAELHLGSSSLFILLKALGLPSGNKAKQDFRVPKFIFKLPLWQKRLFLASFFGAELSSPKIFKNRTFNFYTPVLGINKREKYIDSGKKFLEDISKLLKDFDIETKKISLRKEQKNIDGETSYRLRLILSSTPKNLLNLWSKISFEYQKEKSFFANASVHFLRYKINFIKNKILNLGIKSRKGLIVWNKNNDEDIENFVFNNNRNLARPHKNEVLDFNEFISKFKFGNNGIFWDEIVKIEKIKFNGFVYDFTVNHKNHNFIANNFIVSNCGYDINCGVRLLKSNLTYDEIKAYLAELTKEFYREIPSGVGRGGRLKLNNQELDRILEGGARRIIEMGYGDEKDLERIESNGKLNEANADYVSKTAKERGRDQLGTIGAGNHFVEIDKVEKIFDKEMAEKFGLFENQICILIHTGSRGLGHQVATDYIRKMLSVLSKYEIELPDRELACAPFLSPEGQEYFFAMSSAANFAWANRELITWEVRKAWQNVLGKKSAKELEILYDVAHNIAKIEEYEIEGKMKKLIVHRKGATRAFPNQPVLIPGSMGTASYVLVGQQKSLEYSFGSTCHGAGRRMSRAKAKKTIRGSELKKELENRGIAVEAGSMSGLAEEAPEAYKDVNEVVEIVHQIGIAQKLTKLKPIGVIKG